MGEPLPLKNDYQIFDVQTLEQNLEIVKTEDESSKSRSRCRWKRWLLALLMVILISAASIFAAFFAINITSPQVLFHKERQLENSDMWIREEAIVDSNNNYVTYEIGDVNNTHARVIIDSNREIQIYKTTVNGVSVCLISPVFIMPEQQDDGFTSSASPTSPTTSSNQARSSSTNSSFFVLPDYVDLSKLSKSDGRAAPIQRVKSSRAIREKNLLGVKGKILCADVEVYWTERITGVELKWKGEERENSTSATTHDSSEIVNPGNLLSTPFSFSLPSNQNATPSTNSTPSTNPTPTASATSTTNATTGEENLARRKRQAQRRYFACYYNFDKCYYFSFPDDYYNAVYYTCDIECRWYYF